MPLDAAERARGSHADVARNGLGRSERRKHGDDPRIGNDFVAWPSAPDDRALGIVDFSIFPHLFMTESHTLAAAERWAADIAGPAYAIDDQTAIKVTDGLIEVVSEGHWELLAPND